MSRILFVSQSYWPSHDAVSQILSELAQGLAERNHEVHILTNGSNYLTGQKLSHREIHGRVCIHRIPAASLQRNHPALRIASYMTFLILSGPALALVPHPDLVVYLSAPPLLAWSSILLKWPKRTRTVYWAQDVYPDVAIAAGYLNNPILRATIETVERQIENAVDCIVVIGDLMKKVFESRNVPPARIRTIPNWSVSKRGKDSRGQSNPLRKRLGLKDQFVIQYSGNMGIVHDMEPIIQAMVGTASDDSLHWLIIGDGKRRGELETAVSAKKLGNVTFLPYQPIEELWTTLQAADASIISLRPQLEGLVVPSKVYGSMEAGIPIIFIGDQQGEVGQTLSQHGCGLSVRDGHELIRAIRALHNNPDYCHRMGLSGRRAYDEHFGRTRAIEQFDSLISELCS